MTGLSALPIAHDASEDENSDSHLTGTPYIRGPEWAKLPILTVGLLGVQTLWSVEMSYASPYLLSLGLSKSSMAIVFLAGPLSGLIVQPLVGVLADASTSRFGRRRPYMICGTALTVVAMLLLGYTREFASVFASGGALDTLTIALAVLAIYCIDFSINAVMSVDRALLVDTLPTAQQAAGNAWAARMLGMGSVAGFYVGNIDLPSWLPFIGSTELQVLSVVASLLLLGSHLTTAFGVTERVRVKNAHAASNPPKKSLGLGIKKEIHKVWTGARALPSVIKQICIIQLFAWLYWFPILFYTSVWIGELYRRSLDPASLSTAAEVVDAEEEGTRLGARALFWNSLISLVGNVVLPYLTQDPASSETATYSKGGWREALNTRLDRFKIPLATLWAISHAVFALCMAGTFFTSSVWGATLLITITGFSWAVTQWVPFALLGEAILSAPIAGEGGSIQLADARTYAPIGQQDEEQQFLVGDDHDDGDAGHEQGNGLMHRKSNSSETERRPDSASVMLNPNAQISAINIHSNDTDVEDGPEGQPERGLSAQAGVILGIHNIFIVIPQFISTGITSIIFAIFDPGKSVVHGQVGEGSVVNATSTSDVANSTHVFVRQDLNAKPEGPNSVAIVFRLGGLSAAVAFVLAWRLARGLKHR